MSGVSHVRDIGRSRVIRARRGQDGGREVRWEGDRKREQEDRLPRSGERPGAEQDDKGKDCLVKIIVVKIEVNYVCLLRFCIIVRSCQFDLLMLMTDYLNSKI